MMVTASYIKEPPLRIFNKETKTWSWLPGECNFRRKDASSCFLQMIQVPSSSPKTNVLTDGKKCAQIYIQTRSLKRSFKNGSFFHRDRTKHIGFLTNNLGHYLGVGEVCCMDEWMALVYKQQRHTHLEFINTFRIYFLFINCCRMLVNIYISFFNLLYL